MPSHPIAAAGLFLLGEEYLLLFMGLNSQYHDLTALRRIARPRSIVEPFSVLLDRSQLQPLHAGSAG